MPPGCGDSLEIRRLQQRKLRVLLALLADRNQFYAPRIRDAGVDPVNADIDHFCARFPPTTRTDWMEDQLSHPPFGTMLTFEEAAYARVCRTSGTSGRSMLWLDTPDSWNAMLDNWRRVYDVCGVTNESRILFAFSFGPFLGFWTAFEAAASMGCLCIPTGGFSSASRLELMRDLKADVVCCTPTYAIRLAQVATERGLKPNEFAITTFLVAGEPGGSLPSVRGRISGLWSGASVRDQHGMTEIGPVSYPCPSEPDVLHIMESSYLPEVVDRDSGRPVGNGETGELILTTLDRLGSPLLRYRTGDVVCAARREPCACGTAELSLLGGILGRCDDMVCVRGVNVFPSAVDEIVRSIAGIGEYEVVVDTSASLPELQLRIEPRSGEEDGRQLRESLQANIERALALRVPVDVVEPASLPRYEFKAQRWKRI